MNQAELAITIEEHRIWLKGQKQEGIRLRLNGSQFIKLDISQESFGCLW